MGFSKFSVKSKKTPENDALPNVSFSSSLLSFHFASLTLVVFQKRKETKKLQICHVVFFFCVCFIFKNWIFVFITFKLLGTTCWESCKFFFLSCQLLDFTVQCLTPN